MEVAAKLRCPSPWGRSRARTLNAPVAFPNSGRGFSFLGGMLAKLNGFSRPPAPRCSSRAGCVSRGFGFGTFDANQKAGRGLVRYEETIRKPGTRSVARESSFWLASDRPSCQRGGLVFRGCHHSRELAFRIIEVRIMRALIIRNWPDLATKLPPSNN
jgi:hypothetical protein